MVDVEKLLAAIAEVERIYIPDEPEDEFDVVVPKDEELHTLVCAKYMTSQNAKCSCAVPEEITRRCEADRLTAGLCREVLSIGTSAAAETLARLVLTNLAQAYGVAIASGSAPTTGDAL